MDEQQNIIIYRTADGKASVALYARDGKICSQGDSPLVLSLRSTNKSPIFFDFFRSRYSVSVLQFSKGFSHTLKILLYLYINIELIFDLHTIDFGTVTL